MNDNFDDEERINLALNTDFDSALLNCLDDDDDQDNDDLGDTSDFSHSPTRPSSPVDEECHIARLPSFLLNHEGTDSHGTATTSLNGDDHPYSMVNGTTALPETAATATAQTKGVSTVAGRAGPNYYESSGGLPPQTLIPPPSQMHPFAIPSSASCPPVNNTGNNNSHTNGNNTGLSNPFSSMPGLADPSLTAALQAAFAASFMQQFSTTTAYNPALVPLAYNAMAAGVDLSNFLPQFQPPVPLLTANTTTTATAATATALEQNSAQQRAQSSKSAPGQEQASAKPPPYSKNPKRKRSGQSSSNKRSKSNNNKASQQQKQQPPFLLFDAPVELRQNFIQSQRAHGMPVLEDNNSYHFGMTVNGFHPQRSLDEPYLYKSLNVKGPFPDPVPVIDARHADVGSKRLKNAKEQKRAHRISELIDQLRVKMERGGWKVGMKSKFHTLSSCSDYVRHLIKLNEEKEAAVQQAKNDLASKQEKMEEESRAQQDPSEPESTTSSLTVSSQSDEASKKHKLGRDMDASASDYKKKARLLDSHESTISSVSLSDDAKHPSLSFGPTSTISEMTDSSKGGVGKVQDDLQESDETVSSEAALASRTETTRSYKRHNDVIVAVSSRSESTQPASHGDTSVASEKTSLDTDFQLDYEEVFLRSNVPQILASTNGRVVAFNDFFLKISGLSHREVERLTIFSLVHTSLLSKLFEIVAAALRSNESEPDQTDKATHEEKAKEEEEKIEEDEMGQPQDERKLVSLKDYAAITLPCVDFATAFLGNRTRHYPSVPTSRKLYMTVTLMTDSDIRKRCFHCAFTDCPGTQGALGSVTPELLSALFTSSRDHPTQKGMKKDSADK